MRAKEVTQAHLLKKQTKKTPPKNTNQNKNPLRFKEFFQSQEEYAINM